MSETSLAMILAGGKGDRLSPLTNDRAKPAVPFSRYRIIDFNASSLLNAGVQTLLFLPQYEPRSLDIHVNRAYGGFRGEREIRMVYPRQIRTESGNTEFAWYKGTAHAVKQNIDEITTYNHPDHVMVFSGDHVCSIDVSDMLQEHHRGPRDLTIAAEVRDLLDEDFEISKDDGELRYKYGVLRVDDDDRVLEFLEKKTPEEMKRLGPKVLVSMGNYVFHTDPLVRSLEKVDARFNDFGKNVIPEMISNGMNVFAYRFTGYWRDVGDVVSFYNACMDLNNENPPINFKELKSQKRPIITEGGDITPSRIRREGLVSTISDGCEIDGVIKNCVLGQNVVVGKDSTVTNSVIFPNVTIETGVVIKDAIIDKYNIIHSGTSVGILKDADILKEYAVVPGKRNNEDITITVVPRTDPPKTR